MSTFSLEHKSLGSRIRGLNHESVVKFLGIPYGQITERFATPLAITSLAADLDCTQYGPRCPQVGLDVGHLLRIPPHPPFPIETEDEFACLNLDVVLPRQALAPGAPKLPVMIWIHGGSQTITFGSSASGVCDMTTIIKDSVRIDKPMIAVSVQHRLNIFAFGDGAGPKNCALLDQALALQWVQKHIGGFGGDPDKITLAGESAGAVYCHAHLVTKAPVKQFILSSGSLYLSPPQPEEVAIAFREKISQQLQNHGTSTLRTAPVAELVEAVQRSGIQSWFIQSEDRLKGWQETLGDAQRLLLSDVENEAIIWRNGVWSTNEDAIIHAFDLAGEHKNELKRLYNIFPGRISSCRIGALDFINDCRFTLATEKMVRQWRDAQRSVFRCLIDERNPWQPSNGANHGNDLVLLFGGFDLSFAPTAQQVGEKMRTKWIEFINLEEPWSGSSYVAFGPHGVYEDIDEKGFRSRRRALHLEYLKTIDSGILGTVFAALAAGKISLFN